MDTLNSYLPQGLCKGCLLAHSALSYSTRPMVTLPLLWPQAPTHSCVNDPDAAFRSWPHPQKLPGEGKSCRTTLLPFSAEMHWSLEAVRLRVVMEYVTSHLWVTVLNLGHISSI